MVCAEWWAFEILSIFAGWITVEALDAHSVIVQFEYLTYMIPVGFALAASTRIGNALGMKDIDLFSMMSFLPSSSFSSSSSSFLSEMLP